VRLKIEAEYASGDEGETSVIIMNTKYLQRAKRYKLIRILASNIGS
jgi:hypothetical protein